MSDFIDVPNFSHNLKHSRSPAIPKEVNQYVLINFGAAYYNSTDFYERQELLKSIETTLNQAGYQITAGGIERRLKNMKSHYRRKKADLEVGSASKVDWQYFDILHKIFSMQEAEGQHDSKTSDLNDTKQKKETDPNIASTSSKAAIQTSLKPRRGVKRTRRLRKQPYPSVALVPTKEINRVQVLKNASSFSELKEKNPSIDYDQPQDLTVKKPKLENIQPQPAPLSTPEVEFQAPAANTVQNDQQLSYLSSFLNDPIQANHESNQKILAGLHAINEHRTALSNQIQSLENRRRELDQLGLQLTNFLIIFQQIDARENLGIYHNTV